MAREWGQGGRRGTSWPGPRTQCRGGGRAAQVAGKQMVGVYLSVWARRQLLPALRGVQVTAVGTGVMGYMGNKGARAARRCVPGDMPGAQSLGAGQLCVSLQCGRHRI